MDSEAKVLIARNTDAVIRQSSAALLVAVVSLSALVGSAVALAWGG